jgi:hypothetical protein
MAFRALTAALLLAGASTAWAQDDDALLPTHLIDGGQVFATGTLLYFGGDGDATFGPAGGDFKQSAFLLRLDAGIGLGMGFEVDASINYQFIGKTKSDFAAGGNTAEFESENVGFGDLVLNPRWAPVRDSATSPQLVVGAILVAPVGNDKSGTTGTTINGVETAQQEDGGNGDGIWRYGFEAGLSKRLTAVEPYLVVNYVFADDRTKNGVQEEGADVLNISVGAFIHLGSSVTLDARAVVTRLSEEKSETSGTQDEEEAHNVYTVQAALHLKAGSSATFLITAGVSFVEDHEVSQLAQIDLEDTTNWFVGIGLHLLFGKADPQK